MWNLSRTLACITSAGAELSLKTFKELGFIKGFKIVAHNIRSLLPKINQIKWEMDDAHVDVICFSETWLRPEIESSLLVISGYEIIRLDRNTMLNDGLKTGGGL